MREGERTLPTFDGLRAAHGSLYAVTENSSIVCCQGNDTGPARNPPSSPPSVAERRMFHHSIPSRHTCCPTTSPTINAAEETRAY